MYFPGMKLGSKIFSFIDIFMATYQRSPKTETAGPPGETRSAIRHSCTPLRCNNKNVKICLKTTTYIPHCNNSVITMNLQHSSFLL